MVFQRCLCKTCIRQENNRVMQKKFKGCNSGKAILLLLLNILLAVPVDAAVLLQMFPAGD